MSLMPIDHTYGGKHKRMNIVSVKENVRQNFARDRPFSNLLTSSPSLKGGGSFEVVAMRRKNLHNLWACHRPVSTSRVPEGIGGAYVYCSYDVSVKLGSTGLAFVESSSFGGFGAVAPGADAARICFVYHGDGDAMVFCGMSQAVYELSVAPEVVNHLIRLLAKAVVFQDSCEVADEYLVHIVVCAGLDEVGDELVGHVSVVACSFLVEPAELSARVSVVGGFEDALVVCYSAVPVPPIGEHLVPTVDKGLFVSGYDGGDGASDSDVNIGFVMPTWLRYWFSPNRLIGTPAPMSMVILEFQLSLFARPTGPSFDSALDSELKREFSSFNLILVASEENSENWFASVSVFPVAGRRDTLDVCGEFSSCLHRFEFEETPPRMTILPTHTLGGGTTDPALETIILAFPIPGDATCLEELLSAFVVENIPEGDTPLAETNHLFGVLEHDFETITPSHNNISYAWGGI